MAEGSTEKPIGGLYESAIKASQAVKERYEYWTGQLTGTSFQLSVALIAANWAVFGSSDKILRNWWAAASLLIVLAGLGISLWLTRSIGEALRDRVRYAESDPTRWETEFHETRGKAEPWPYDARIDALARCLRWLKLWAPVAAGALLAIAIAMGSAETSKSELPAVTDTAGATGSPFDGSASAAGSTPIREPGPDSAARALWALVWGASLCVIAGALLLGLARGLWAKGVGTAMVAAGLFANGSVIREVNVGDLFKVEARIDKASLELEFGKRIQALSEFGPEVLGVVEDFESGQADVRSHMVPALKDICGKWTQHGGRRQRGVLLVIGSTDRVPLTRITSTQYESNVGLARARAERVRERLLECDVPSSQLVTLVSGPRHTPPGNSGASVEDRAKDRSVAVVALWSVPTERR